MQRFVFSGLLFGMALCGCTHDSSPSGTTTSGEQPTPEPLPHFQEVIEAFRAGRLALAYSRYFPTRYDEDLNRLFDKLKALLDQEDFARLRSFSQTLGARVAAALESRAESDPGIARLKGYLSDPGALLGATSYEELQSLHVRDWLERIEKAGLGQWIASEEMQERLGEPRLSLSRHKGTYARLVLERGPEGIDAERESEELVVVDGKWVTLGMAASWQSQMDGLDAMLEELLEHKREDQDFLREKIEGWEAAVEALAATIPDMLDRLVNGLPLTRPPASE